MNEMAAGTYGDVRFRPEADGHEQACLDLCVVVEQLPLRSQF